MIIRPASPAPLSCWPGQRAGSRGHAELEAAEGGAPGFFDLGQVVARTHKTLIWQRTQASGYNL